MPLKDAILNPLQKLHLTDRNGCARLGCAMLEDQPHLGLGTFIAARAVAAEVSAALQWLSAHIGHPKHPIGGQNN